VIAETTDGCAYCVDMHTLDARKRGEREQRLAIATRMVPGQYQP
jgi:AhpD family alkylhydroperoxidase